MVVLRTPTDIDNAKRLTLRAMLRMEILGLRRSRGRTAYSMLKDEYGYKGTRASVLAQLDKWRDELLRYTTEGELE